MSSRLTVSKETLLDAALDDKPKGPDQGNSWLSCDGKYKN